MQSGGCTYPVTIVQADQLKTLQEWPPHPDNLTKWRAHANLGLELCIHNNNVSIFGPNTLSLTEVQLQRIQYMNKYAMEPLLLKATNSVAPFLM